MTSTHLLFILKASLAGAGLMSLLLSELAFAQPSQKPLTNRDGGGVSPNLIVTLDTSASMDFQHAPEYSFKIKTGTSTTATVTFPNFSFYWMHPYDPGPGYYDGSFKGIVPSNPYRGTTADSMLFQMQMRSPDLNTIYYNPELRYQPWVKSDWSLTLDSRYPVYPPNSAPFIPNLDNLKLGASPFTVVGRANLETASYVTVSASKSIKVLNAGTDSTATRSATVTWCGKFTAPNTPTCTTTAENFYPMVYYRLNKNADGVTFKDPNNFQNYTFVDINTKKTGTSKSNSVAANWTGLTTLTNFPKGSQRTDCVTTAGVCTQTEERQNYANWFTYYRSRMLLAQGAIPEAFREIDNTMRLGWGRIHKSTATKIDGTASSADTKIVDSGVRELTTTTRDRFYKWIRNHPGNTDTTAASGTVGTAGYYPGKVSYTTTGGTPLIEAVTGVGDYYKRSDNGGPWSDDPSALSTAAHKTCRRAYNMLVTDGYYSNSSPGVGNVDATAGSTITGPAASYTYAPVSPYKDSSSNTLADVAMKYWVNDLRPTGTGAVDNGIITTADNPAFWQHMTNYMIGLGVNGTLDKVADWPGLVAGTKSWPAPTDAGRIDDLWHAAVNSRGAFYSAKNPKELTEGIKNSLGQTLQRELRESGVATASATLQEGNRKYVPLYNTGAWSGDIQAYFLDANGQAGALAWNAEAKLPLPSARNIFTWRSDTGAAASFLWGSIGAANQTAMGSVAATHTTSFVDFIRGDRSNEGDGFPFRARKSAIGDFVNSNPVLIKDAVDMAYGALPTIGTSYAAFLTAKKARVATLFVGGNDGMVHAFKDNVGTGAVAEDGTEVFAFIPKTVLPNLYKLADKTYGTTALYHQFFVDGRLVETDAHVKAPAASTASWRNYLLGSLGAGGRGVFALDVTSAPTLTASSVRWELSNADNGDIGYVSSSIAAGVLPNGDWVAIFGNGAFSDSGKAVLFVVNLETGAIQSLVAESALGTNGLGGVGVVRNGTGQITSVYAGDLNGSLWKFNYDAGAASKFSISGSTAFFTATNSGAAIQPITQAPIIYDHSLGGKLIVFGTGVLNTETDANSTSVQSIYGIWDKAADSVSRPMNRTLAATRTLTEVAGAGGATFYSLTGTAVDWTTQRGWVIDLTPISGLRVVYPPQVISSTFALVSAISPAQNVVACLADEGTGVNLLFPVEEGVNPTFPLFDVNGSDGITSADTLVAGYKTKADGIDAVVRGVETCVGTTCTTKLSIQNTVSQIGAQLQRTIVVSGTPRDRIWRRILNPPIR